MVLLLTEILHNLVLHTVPPRVRLGDHILVSVQSCSAPRLCPAVRVLSALCFRGFWSRGLVRRGADGVNAGSWLGSSAPRTTQGMGHADMAVLAW